MYTRRKRCLPIFHSTSTTSKPSERATRSAASRTFSKFTQRLHGLRRSKSSVPAGGNKKVGLRPPYDATRFQSENSVYSPCTVKARHPNPD